MSQLRVERDNPSLWGALLSLNERLRTATDCQQPVSLLRRSGQWSVHDNGVTPGTSDALVPIHFGQADLDPVMPALDQVDGLDLPTQSFLRLYLPMILGMEAAHRNKRTFVTGHIAQTIDGRIACESGHSQWISNEANLHHAHRLRALHDACLVGGATVRNDNPRLTVRHVEGKDPQRVIVSGSGRALSSAEPLLVATPPGCILVHGESSRDDLPPMPEDVETWALPDKNGSLDLAVLCDLLYGRGIRSVFVEGGGTTLSQLLQASRLDILHVHIAPRILGSGTPAFRLPEVDSISASTAIEMTHFDLDGEVLLECRTARLASPLPSPAP